MDYLGYKLANLYGDLTPEQSVFILMGRAELEKKMNSVDKKKYRR